MVAAISAMRSTSATYSSRMPGRSRERNTITIMASPSLDPRIVWRITPSRHARLERLHVVVGEAEMVADLVHQHMGDDRAQRLVVLGPVVEDRPAVEPHH